jgi:hypothetical protein
MAQDPTSNPAAGTKTCNVCGKPGAALAYFATGMTEVVYRHHECDRIGSPLALPDEALLSRHGSRAAARA